MTESGGTPPGWYVDNAGQRRWWDGNAWTEHIDTGQAAPAAAAGTGYGQATAGAVQPAGFGQWPPPWYLEGGPSDLQGAVRNAIDNIFEYRGRASRSSYWWFVLGEFLVFIAMYVVFLVVAVIGVDVLTLLVGLVLFVASIGLILAGLSAAIRRLHDTDRSGWWYLIAFVPLVGGVILLVLLVLESTPGPNQYNIDLTGATHSL